MAPNRSQIGGRSISVSGRNSTRGTGAAEAAGPLFNEDMNGGPRLVDLEPLVIHDSDSESEQDVPELQREKNLQFLELLKKARVINHECIISKRSIFPYKKLENLFADIKQKILTIHSETTKDFIWENVLVWLYAMQRSFEGLHDLKHDDRFNLILSQIIAEYIHYKCWKFAKSEITDNQVVTDDILAVFSVLFETNYAYVLMTLLRIDFRECEFDKKYVSVLCPIFKKYLTKKFTYQSNNFSYSRLILCFKKWKSLVHTTEQKEKINNIAMGDYKLEKYPTGLLPSEIPQKEEKELLLIFPLYEKAKEMQIEYGRNLGTRALLRDEKSRLDDMISAYFKVFTASIENEEDYIDWYFLEGSSTQLDQQQQRQRISFKQKIGINQSASLSDEVIVLSSSDDDDDDGDHDDEFLYSDEEAIINESDVRCSEGGNNNNKNNIRHLHVRRLENSQEQTHYGAFSDISSSHEEDDWSGDCLPSSGNAMPPNYLVPVAVVNAWPNTTVSNIISTSPMATFLHSPSNGTFCSRCHSPKINNIFVNKTCSSEQIQQSNEANSENSFNTSCLQSEQTSRNTNCEIAERNGNLKVLTMDETALSSNISVQTETTLGDRYLTRCVETSASSDNLSDQISDKMIQWPNRNLSANPSISQERFVNQINNKESEKQCQKVKAFFMRRCHSEIKENKEDIQKKNDRKLLNDVKETFEITTVPSKTESASIVANDFFGQYSIENMQSKEDQQLQRSHPPKKISKETFILSTDKHEDTAIPSNEPVSEEKESISQEKPVPEKESIQEKNTVSETELVPQKEQVSGDCPMAQLCLSVEKLEIMTALLNELVSEGKPQPEKEPHPGKEQVSEDCPIGQLSLPKEKLEHTKTLSNKPVSEEKLQPEKGPVPEKVLTLERDTVPEKGQMPEDCPIGQFSLSTEKFEDTKTLSNEPVSEEKPQPEKAPVPEKDPIPETDAVLEERKVSEDCPVGQLSLSTKKLEDTKTLSNDPVSEEKPKPEKEPTPETDTVPKKGQMPEDCPIGQLSLSSEKFKDTTTLSNEPVSEEKPQPEKEPVPEKEPTPETDAVLEERKVSEDCPVGQLSLSTEKLEETKTLSNDPVSEEKPQPEKEPAPEKEPTPETDAVLEERKVSEDCPVGQLSLSTEKLEDRKTLSNKHISEEKPKPEKESTSETDTVPEKEQMPKYCPIGQFRLSTEKLGDMKTLSNEPVSEEKPHPEEEPVPEKEPTPETDAVPEKGKVSEDCPVGQLSLSTEKLEDRKTLSNKHISEEKPKPEKESTSETDTVPEKEQMPKYCPIGQFRLSTEKLEDMKTLSNEPVSEEKPHPEEEPVPEKEPTPETDAVPEKGKVSEDCPVGQLSLSTEKLEDMKTLSNGPVSEEKPHPEEEPVPEKEPTPETDAVPEKGQMPEDCPVGQLSISTKEFEDTKTLSNEPVSEEKLQPEKGPVPEKVLTLETDTVPEKGQMPRDCPIGQLSISTKKFEDTKTLSNEHVSEEKPQPEKEPVPEKEPTPETDAVLEERKVSEDCPVGQLSLSTEKLEDMKTLSNEPVSEEKPHPEEEPVPEKEPTPETDAVPEKGQMPEDCPVGQLSISTKKFEDTKTLSNEPVSEEKLQPEKGPVPEKVLTLERDTVPEKGQMPRDCPIGQLSISRKKFEDTKTLSNEPVSEEKLQPEKGPVPEKVLTLEGDTVPEKGQMPRDCPIGQLSISTKKFEDTKTLSNEPVSEEKPQPEKEPVPEKEPIPETDAVLEERKVSEDCPVGQLSLSTKKLEDRKTLSNEPVSEEKPKPEKEPTPETDTIQVRVNRSNQSEVLKQNIKKERLHAVVDKCMKNKNKQTKQSSEKSENVVRSKNNNEKSENVVRSKNNNEKSENVVRSKNNNVRHRRKPKKVKGNIQIEPDYSANSKISTSPKTQDEALTGGLNRLDPLAEFHITEGSNSKRNIKSNKNSGHKNKKKSSTELENAIDVLCWQPENTAEALKSILVDTVQDTSQYPKDMGNVVEIVGEDMKNGTNQQSVEIIRLNGEHLSKSESVAQGLITSLNKPITEGREIHNDRVYGPENNSSNILNPKNDDRHNLKNLEIKKAGGRIGSKRYISDTPRTYGSKKRKRTQGLPDDPNFEKNISKPADVSTITLKIGNDSHTVFTEEEFRKNIEVAAESTVQTISLEKEIGEIDKNFRQTSEQKMNSVRNTDYVHEFVEKKKSLLEKEGQHDGDRDLVLETFLDKVNSFIMSWEGSTGRKNKANTTNMNSEAPDGEVENISRIPTPKQQEEEELHLECEDTYDDPPPPAYSPLSNSSQINDDDNDKEPKPTLVGDEIPVSPLDEGITIITSKSEKSTALVSPGNVVIDEISELDKGQAFTEENSKTSIPLVPVIKEEIVPVTQFHNFGEEDILKNIFDNDDKTPTDTKDTDTIFKNEVAKLISNKSGSTDTPQCEPCWVFARRLNGHNKTTVDDQTDDQDPLFLTAPSDITSNLPDTQMGVIDPLVINNIVRCLDDDDDYSRSTTERNHSGVKDRMLSSVIYFDVRKSSISVEEEGGWLDDAKNNTDQKNNTNKMIPESIHAFEEKDITTKSDGILIESTSKICDQDSLNTISIVTPKIDTKSVLETKKDEMMPDTNHVKKGTISRSHKKSTPTKIPLEIVNSKNDIKSSSSEIHEIPKCRSAPSQFPWKKQKNQTKRPSTESLNGESLPRDEQTPIKKFKNDDDNFDIVKNTPAPSQNLYKSNRIGSNIYSRKLFNAKEPCYSKPWEFKEVSDEEVLEKLHEQKRRKLES